MPFADKLVHADGAYAVGEVTFGIIGTGQAAGTFAQALRDVPNARLGAVGSRDMTRATAFSDRFGAPRAYGSYQEVAQDPGVDVVYVATPASRHPEDALCCLDASKNVLVEKPFAPTLADAEQMIASARQNDLFCMEAMWMRFVPGLRRALDRVKSGEIGETKMLFADFGAPEPFEPGSHFFDGRAGGAWLDRGVYGVSLAIALFGEPIDVAAKAILAPTGCDLQSSAVLTFDGGQVAVIAASTLAYTGNEALVAGSEGRLRLAEPFVRPEIILSRSAPKPAQPAGDGSSRTIKDRLRSSGVARRLRSWFPRESREFIPYIGNGYYHEAAEVVRCVTAGERESPLMPWQETIGVAKVNDRVRAAWQDSD